MRKLTKFILLDIKIKDLKIRLLKDNNYCKSANYMLINFAISIALAILNQNL